MGRAVAMKFAKEGHSVAITYTKNRRAAEDVLELVKSMGRNGMAVEMELSNASRSIGHSKHSSSVLRTRRPDSTMPGFF